MSSGTLLPGITLPLRSPASDALKSLSVPDPLADRGKHTIRYSLVPHSRNWKEALVYRKAYEFNFDPYVRSIKLQQKKKKNEPGEKSFLKIEPDNVVLTAFKRCEEESGHNHLEINQPNEGQVLQNEPFPSYYSLWSGAGCYQKEFRR